ncbi:MAG: NAD-dependent epimerase/dehydratase family protein [Hyphomicrobiaceae bacterium]
MRILVTGGAGFIGTHLSRRLVADGHAVTVIDNEFNGRRENVPAGATFIFADVTKPQDIEPIFAGGFDAVCHLAGQVSIIRSFDDPVVDLRVNVEGTLNVLQMCLRHAVPRLVYASSMTAYGDTRVVPTPETEPCRPDSYYGITKHAAERYVHSTVARPDLKQAFEAISLRMFSVYGPGQALDNPYQGVLGIFMGKLLRGETITIFGDGEQTRDFVYIADIVDGWVKALTHMGESRIFNLGSGRSLSIKDLAAQAIAAYGGDPGVPRLAYAPARPGEQRTVQADITRARTDLGWHPATPFDVGLAETMRQARIVFAAERAAAAVKTT